MGPHGAPWSPMGLMGPKAPWRPYFVGSCVPGQTLKLGKPGIGHFEKTWIGIFSKYFENRCMFSNYFEKYPRRRLWRRPPGAAAHGGGGIFSKSFENIPYFQNILNICQSMFFKVANSRFSKFQVLARDARSQNFGADLTRGSCPSISICLDNLRPQNSQHVIFWNIQLTPPPHR